MKILYVSDARSIHTQRWAEHFRDRGDEVHVASFRSAVIRGVAVHVLPSFFLGRLGYPLAVPSLRRLFRKIGPDVVHAQYLTSFGFLSAVAGLRPLIVTAWGSDALIAPRHSRIMRLLAGYAVSRARVVTTVARHMNAAVAELGGISESEVLAIPFGVDLKIFSPAAQPPIVLGPLRVICTRNFSEVYSVHTLIAATKKLQTRGIPVSLELVGDGPLRASLEGLVHRLGLEACVTFHGHVDQIRLVELLRGSHIFVSPSLSDGNNVSLNEAMACGVFPIATDIPANAQWIKNSEGGLLYRPGDENHLGECLERAISNASLRAQASALNREIVELYADWRTCTEHMGLIYESVMRTGICHEAPKTPRPGSIE